jgi:Carboxypeptidase regulatory-like domain
MRVIASQAPPPPQSAAAVPHRLPEAPSAASPVIDTASTVEPAHTEPPLVSPVPSQQPAAGAARKQLLVPRAPEATFAAKRPVHEPTAAFATGAMPPGSASGGDLKLSVEHGQSTPNGLSEVKGSVADLSGAAVPGATVTVRPLAGSAGSTAKTGADGQFAINALPAGQYELQIESPGFQTASTQVELQPQDLAMVESKLSIGSTSESVEVTAASPVLSTERSASLSIQQAHPLPSKLPVVSSANNGLGIIAVDSAGTLFFRQSRRKQWEIVNPQWPGKATRVAVSPGSMVGQQFGQGKSSAALPPSSAVRPPVFHLYTDKGSAWFSQDGTHWYPELPKR